MMRNRFKTYGLLAFIGISSFVSCENKQDRLPILGHKSIEGKDTRSEERRVGKECG